jgi:hypothetical protein
MTTQPSEISVAAPVSPAIEHTKRVLFRPFDLGKWFVIGFCAWLAGLGERGGSFNVPGGGGGGHGGGGGQPGQEVQHAFEQVRDYFIHNWQWLVPVVATVLLLVFALGFLFIWLSCRGKFMFLHCVALNKAEVAGPWNKYAAEANSLFWFRLGLALVGMLIFLPIFVVIGLIIYSMGIKNNWNPAGFVSLFGLGMVFLVGALAFGIINLFTKEFVVPIMYLQRKRCVEAWGVFRRLLTANVGRFVLYLLFQIVLGLAIGTMILAIVLVTCCVAGCFLSIPYIGTVLMLPVLVFMRSYSLLYFAQYGPEYNVFPPPASA